MSNVILKTEFSLPGQTNLYKGKVRDVYSVGEDTLVMIALVEFQHSIMFCHKEFLTKDKY